MLGLGTGPPTNICSTENVNKYVYNFLLFFRSLKMKVLNTKQFAFHVALCLWNHGCFLYIFRMLTDAVNREPNYYMAYLEPSVYADVERQPEPQYNTPYQYLVPMKSLRESTPLERAPMPPRANNFV